MTRRNRLIIAGVIAVILLGGFTINLLSAQDDSNRPTTTVTKGSVAQNVTITGKTKPVDRVDLTFERSGRVTYIIPVGSRARAGQTLASIDAGEIGAQIRQAQASLRSATAQRNQYAAALQIQSAKLQEIRNGTRPEEIIIKETEIQKAEQDIAASNDNLLTTLADAYTKADNVLASTVGGLFSGSPGNYSLTYNTCDIQAKTDAEFRRSGAQRALSEWSATDATLALTHLSTIKQFLDRTRDTLLVECAMNDTGLNAHRTSVSAAITTIVSAQSSVKSAQQLIASQKFTVQRLKNELTLKQAGAVEQQVSAQESAVKQAEASLAAQDAQIAYATANVQLYQAQASKFILRAPFDGIVTATGIRRGEIASGSKAAVTLMGQDSMEIEAYIPEVDVSKVALNQPVTATVDAIPGESIAGTIMYIDPAETIVDGVVSYKIRIVPTKKDERLKSGLTANITITVARADNVLTLPNYAIAETDAGTFAEILQNGSAKQIPVTIGLRGTDGKVEIVSGVTEGQAVISVGLKTQ